MSSLSCLYSKCKKAHDAVIGAAVAASGISTAADSVRAIHAAQAVLHAFAMEDTACFRSMFSDPVSCSFQGHFLQLFAELVGIENNGIHQQALDKAETMRIRKPQVALCEAFLSLFENGKDYAAFEIRENEQLIQQQQQQPRVTDRIRRLKGEVPPPQTPAASAECAVDTVIVPSLLTLVAAAGNAGNAEAAGCAGCTTGCAGCAISEIVPIADVEMFTGAFGRWNEMAAAVTAAGTAGPGTPLADADAAAGCAGCASGCLGCAAAGVQGGGTPPAAPAAVSGVSRKRSAAEGLIRKHGRQSTGLESMSAAAARVRKPSVTSHLIIYDPAKQQLAEQRPFIQVEVFSSARFQQLKKDQAVGKAHLEKEYAVRKAAAVAAAAAAGVQGGGTPPAPPARKAIKVNVDDLHCLVFGVICAEDATVTAALWLTHVQLNSNTGYFSGSCESVKELFSADWLEKAPTITDGNCQLPWRTTLAGLLQRAQETEAVLTQMDASDVYVPKKNGGQGVGLFRDMYRWRSPIELALLKAAGGVPPSRTPAVAAADTTDTADSADKRRRV